MMKKFLWNWKSFSSTPARETWAKSSQALRIIKTECQPLGKSRTSWWKTFWKPVILKRVLRGQRTILCDCKSDHTIKLCKQGIQCKFPSCRKIRRHPSMSICLTLHLLFFWGGEMFLVQTNIFWHQYCHIYVWHVSNMAFVMSGYSNMGVKRCVRTGWFKKTKKWNLD